MLFNFIGRLAAPLLALAVILIASSDVAATTYRFTVTCSDTAKVVEWRTGDLDPGREYLRVATGTNNPGCQVWDFNPSADAELPRETLEGGSALLEGVPMIGPILKGLFD